MRLTRLISIRSMAYYKGAALHTWFTLRNKQLVRVLLWRCMVCCRAALSAPRLHDDGWLAADEAQLAGTARASSHAQQQPGGALCCMMGDLLRWLRAAV